MIEVERVTVTYEDGPIFTDVSLTIRDGEFVILAGPNGAGKTSLIRCWNGLETPDSGRVRVNGRAVESDLAAARRAIGMVFQNPRDMFVAPRVERDVAFGPENLGLERAEIRRRVDRALSAVGLADRADARIEGLSAGERRAIAIAGALAMEPDHLVLDEPFVGLDGQRRAQILDRVIDRWRAGTGVVVVTHDLRDLLDVADRVLVLAEGGVAADGPPDSIGVDLERYGIRDPTC